MNKPMTVAIIVGIRGLEFFWLVGFMKKTFLGGFLNSLFNSICYMQ